MPKLNFLITCDSAFVTKDTNNLNIIGAFDAIKSKGFPAMHPRFSVVFKLIADNEKMHEIILSISKEAKKNFETKFTFEGQTIQIIQNFSNFLFPEEGDYLVEVRLDNSLLGSTPLHLKKAD